MVPVSVVILLLIVVGIIVAAVLKQQRVKKGHESGGAYIKYEEKYSFNGV